MSFEVTGKLIVKNDIVVISDKFKKREFVLEKKEFSNGFEFTDYLKFQLTQDKCSILDPFQMGDNLKVNFNLRGNKWEKAGNINYFTNLEAWRIEKTDSESAANIQNNSTSEIPPPEEEDFAASDQEFDDLPF